MANMLFEIFFDSPTWNDLMIYSGLPINLLMANYT